MKLQVFFSAEAVAFAQLRAVYLEKIVIDLWLLLVFDLLETVSAIAAPLLNESLKKAGSQFTISMQWQY